MPMGTLGLDMCIHDVDASGHLLSPRYEFSLRSLGKSRSFRRIRNFFAPFKCLRFVSTKYFRIYLLSEISKCV